MHNYLEWGLTLNKMQKDKKRRWNGWGYEKVNVDLDQRAKNLLESTIGKGKYQKDVPLEYCLNKIPASRLSRHPLITTAQNQRLFHAHGQSLPDWVVLRGGILDRFPDGVAFPVNIKQIQELMDYACRKKIIIIPYGGGTSVVGHLSAPDSDRPVLTVSLKNFNRMISIDTYNRLATFEAGITGPEIEKYLNAKGFTLGHFPQSFEFSTLGGWVVTRSSGQQALKYGSIENLFVGGQMLTPKGQINIRPIPASAAGPDLKHLILGSEARMGILTNITMKISQLPEKDIVHGVFFPSWEDALEAVRMLMGKGIPISMVRLSNPFETEINLAMAGHGRLMDLLKKFLRLRGFQQKGYCMVLIGLAGPSGIVSRSLREVSREFRRFKGVRLGKDLGIGWKKNRFRTPYLRNTLWNMGYAVDTVETAINWDKVTSTMNNIEASLLQGLRPFGENVCAFSHLSHLYPTGSNIYTTFLFRLADTPDMNLLRWGLLKKAASHSILRAGGTISHQHGIGVDHLPFISREKGCLGMELIGKLCFHLDPEKLMNPGKLINHEGF